MIAINGHEWKTLGERIMVGDEQIVAVYAGDKQVYPELAKLFYAMWFNLSQSVTTPYDQAPINQYGARLHYQNGERPIHKVSFYIDETTNPWCWTLFVSIDSFNQANNSLLLAPYIADNGTIIQDGTTSGQISTRQLELSTHNNKQYYRSNTLIGGGESMNLVDSNNNRLANYFDTEGSENCEVFRCRGNAILYVLDEPRKYAETVDEAAYQLIDGGWPDPPSGTIMIYVSYELWSDNTLKTFYYRARNITGQTPEKSVTMKSGPDDLDVQILYTFLQ